MQLIAADPSWRPIMHGPADAVGIILTAVPHVPSTQASRLDAEGIKLKFMELRTLWPPGEQVGSSSKVATPRWWLVLRRLGSGNLVQRESTGPMAKLKPIFIRRPRCPRLVVSKVKENINDTAQPKSFH
jgi:hypothetical protein